MELSWRVIVANSSAVNSSRARCATHVTCSADRDMGHLKRGGWSLVLERTTAFPPFHQPPLQACGHRERLALLGALDATAADALDADTQPLHAAADLALEVLQVRVEGAPADAGDLGADAAEVLGLAALGILVAEHR